MTMRLRSSTLAPASEAHVERKNNTRDAACQTDDLFLGHEQESSPAMKRKVFESGGQATTGPDEQSYQKKAKQSGRSLPAGMMPEMRAVAAKLLDRSRMKEAASSAGGGCSGASSPDVTSNTARPLLPRCPPCPKNASRKKMHEWNMECRRISKLYAEDPLAKLLANLPTQRKSKKAETHDAVASSKDKEMVLRVARSIVSVSSTALDGNFICQCTGIVVSWDEAKKCARILTSYHIVCARGILLDPKPKIHVRLPNKSVSEGQLLFFNKYYNIALLEITTDFPLQLPSFGSNPNYGQEVFVLARDKESFLSSRHGTIVWRDEPDLLSGNYYMFLSCRLGIGNGAPVIDHNGNVIGMAFNCISGYPTKLVSISTMLTCIEMWMKFSRIARPIIHGLCLRSVELLDVSTREEISYSYNIDSGYIVDKVQFDSTAEKVGIRRGDVIVSFDELGVHSLPKLEDFILSLGWEFLERGCDANTVVDLKLEVYDPIGQCTRSIILPVGFCDAQVK
ncbi:unnamed protein product [Urochloa humidicola]